MFAVQLFLINRGQTGRSPFSKKVVHDRSGPDLFPVSVERPLFLKLLSTLLHPTKAVKNNEEGSVLESHHANPSQALDRNPW